MDRKPHAKIIKVQEMVMHDDSCPEGLARAACEHGITEREEIIFTDEFFKKIKQILK